MKRNATSLLVLLPWLVSGCGAQAAPAATEVPDTQEEFVQGEQVIQREQVVSIPVVGTPGAVEVIGGDEGSMRELLARALHYAYGEGGDTLIYVGALPPQLPVEVSLPEGMRVIGAVDRGRTMGTEVFMDAAMEPDEAMAFYREELIDMGWTTPQESFAPTGFVSQEVPSITLCQAGGEAVMWITALQTPEGTTDLRINLQPAPDYSPCVEGYGPEFEGRVQELLPALVSPPGAIVRSGGSSSGTGEGDVSATIRSTLSAEDLAEHYNRQIGEDGWVEVGRGRGAGAAWSFWEREADGEEWVGTFLVLESPSVEGQFFAWFRIELVREVSSAGG